MSTFTDKGKSIIRSAQIDEAMARVYGQDGLSGLARDEQLAAYTDSKNQLADMISLGSPQESQDAIDWGLEMGYFTDDEINNLLEAKVYRETDPAEMRKIESLQALQGGLGATPDQPPANVQQPAPARSAMIDYDAF